MAGVALDAEHSQAIHDAVKTELSSSQSVDTGSMVTDLSYLAHIACKARAGSAGLLKEQFVSTARFVCTYVSLLFLSFESPLRLKSTKRNIAVLLSSALSTLTQLYR